MSQVNWIWRWPHALQRFYALEFNALEREDCTTVMGAVGPGPLQHGIKGAREHYTLHEVRSAPKKWQRADHLRVTLL